VLRDVSERTKDLFSDTERALIDQPPEFFLGHRQFVDVAVAGVADHKNISLSLFWLRFVWLWTRRDTMQFEQRDRGVLAAEFAGAFDCYLDLLYFQR